MIPTNEEKMIALDAIRQETLRYGSGIRWFNHFIIERRVFMKVNVNYLTICICRCMARFDGSEWKREINVGELIQHNYTPYEGDESSSRRQRRRRPRCGKR
ncbi:hypothetical protein ACNKHO_19610 [Shigella flexneri]